MTFKFHKKRTINEEFDLWGVEGGRSGGCGGQDCPNFKNSEKLHREWWSHCNGTPLVTCNASLGRIASDQIKFLVPKDAQFSKTYAKPIFRII